METLFETTGYHQASKSHIEKSILWQNFFTDHREDAWLGVGIYFWKRKSDAEWWKAYKQDAAIASAKLRCLNDLVLNLDTDEGKEEIKSFIDYIQNLSMQNILDIEISGIDGFLFAPALLNLYKRSQGTMLLIYSFPEKNSKPQYCATDGSIVFNVQLAANKSNGKWIWC